MENSTQETGVSIQERIEGFLNTDEPVNQPADEVNAAPEVNTVEEGYEATEGEGEGSEPSISLSDLSKYLGIDEQYLDVDEDGTVAIKTKVDGQEGKTKLKDLQTSYQLRQHLDNETRAVAERQKALQAQAAQYEQSVMARYQQAEDLANAAQAELNRRFQSVDWQVLRVTDPAEYAALIQDYQAQQAHISGITQNAQAQRMQYEEAKRSHAEQSIQSTLASERQALPQAIPEWVDAAVRDKEAGEIRKWALEQGFPQNEVDSVTYARHVAVLRKAMMYDRMQSSKVAVENKVRAAPRLVKPGNTNPNSREQSVRDLKANVKKTGGKNGSLAEYLLATGKV